MSNTMYRNMKLNDEYYTDEKGVLPILKFLKPNSTIWCPFDTKDSQYVKVFEAAGHKVIHSHIWDGRDFLEWEPDEDYDYIISNPPYSIKNEILEKLIRLDKPFAMLIGVQALTIRKFMRIWREHNVNMQLILFENKIFFEQPDMGQKQLYKKPGTYFHTYYFCNGWLPKDLIVEVLE